MRVVHEHEKTDLRNNHLRRGRIHRRRLLPALRDECAARDLWVVFSGYAGHDSPLRQGILPVRAGDAKAVAGADVCRWRGGGNDAEGVRRSEEHTSELKSLMRISYAVFCLNKKKTHSM